MDIPEPDHNLGIGGGSHGQNSASASEDGEKLDDFRIEIPSTITVIEPVGYLDMVFLEEGTSMISTDSGGVQKEALFQGVPCITLRDETEWTELVELGANQLAGTNPQRIFTLIEAAMKTTVPNVRPYGDGNASEVIADFFAQQ